MESRWEFWIDVGGTFTDCVARRPDGTLVRHKLLSSGVTKGIVVAGSTAEMIVDPPRSDAPAAFWDGFTLRLFDRDVGIVGESTVARFDKEASALRLSRRLPVEPREGQAYELVAGDEAPVQAIRWLLGLGARDPISPVSVRLGTTRGTNALITRRGARTALVTTRGFGDVLAIGYQNRPRLFELAIRKPPPLYAAVVEIDERIAADGTILTRPAPEIIRQQLTELRKQGIESLAICLMHGSTHPAHERLIAAIARDEGFREVSVSSDVAPLVKIVARGDTTVVDAYLNPVLRAYIESLLRSLPQCDLRIVTSAGGLVSAERFVGKDSILSGPAAGVVGFSRIAEAAGFQRAIGFDMGGTSTDVSRFDGRFELEYETEKAGVRVVAPMMAIETVAAGGGSICGFDGVKLVVGPDSAGADPGPACYGRGGPLAVTDLNLYLGKILPEYFPFPLDRAAVERRLTEMADTIFAATGTRYSSIDLVEGFLDVANANMARALRTVSIARGCDPRDYLLVPFGGAAGQHACALARELGIGELLCHPDAGLLSARGIGLADHVRHRVEGIYRPYSAETLMEIKRVFERLEGEARAELVAEAILPDNAASQARITVDRRLDLRYQGIEASLSVSCPDDGDYAVAFEAEHRKLYGYTHPGRPLEIVAARVEAIGRWSEPLPKSEHMPVRPVSAKRHTMTWFAGQPHQTQVFTQDELQTGDTCDGPAIVCEAASTTVIDPGWRVEVLSAGELLVSDVQAERRRHSIKPTDSGPWASPLQEADPVLLEIFNNHFAGIAEQMGITLHNTAGSVNVKERLDFSCAIFTAQGELVVNAPHIPVHLGAMGETVRRILADNLSLEPGDVFVTNDPYRGGSHLPDITVITPVHEGRDRSPDGAAPRLLFFTASRAHHAEIGGIVPGSMPPFSKNLAEEGVLIRSFKLIAAGQSRMEELRTLLLAGPHPTRAVDDNLADIAAQVAANRAGAVQLAALIERRGWPIVEAYMGHIQSAAERKLRLALSKLPPGRREFTDHLDDGSPIHATITIEESGPQPVTIDFTGTGPVVPGNLNANRAIVTAAVMYVLRLLIDEEIPLNEGVLAPVRLVLPECLLNPPQRESVEHCAAVAGGNVETSQRVVDVLLGALGLAAASQGTMNNLLFGDATFGYYETICGGVGATPTRDGADAVHTHMTNTRITDPEIIERRYPVRVREFSIRRGSGGQGEHRGGDGVVRRLELLRPLEVSILSERRGPYPPYGLAGGQAGALGRNTLLRADGRMIELDAKAQFTVEPGDILTICTPGGGGWGTSGFPA
jgi:5-oxoprolinase (ATP-hydrolysing)